MKTVTAKELEPILGKTLRSIQRMAEKQSWPYENGKNREKRFEIDGLPAEIQEAVLRWKTGVDEDSVEAMVRSYNIVVSPAQLKDLKTAQLIRMACECLAVPKCRGRDKRIRDIAGQYGYTRATAYRIMKKIKAGKPIRKNTKTWGQTFEGLNITVRAWEPEAARIAIEAIMGNRRSHVEKLSLYNKVSAECARLKLTCGSYRSFCEIAQKIDPSVITYRDKGVRGLREDVIPAIRRDPTAYRPMECLVGDQHKADYYCLDLNGEIATLELFCWLDFRTQMVWPWISYKHYNRYTVGRALTNACRWGLPSVVYTDWGKPEESAYMYLLVEQLKGLGVKCESIRRTHAKVRHPQAKPIEPWFGRLDRNLRNREIRGYCRRLKDDRENELQQKEIKALAREGDLLTIEEMVQVVTGEIKAWNEHAFVNRREDTGKSPIEIYNAETAGHPVTTLSDDVLDYIFLPLERERPVKRSQVKVKHPWLGWQSYYSPDLASYSGAKVDVRWDPYHAARAWVFEGSKLICEAESWGMINPKVRDQVTGKIAHQQALERQIKGLYGEYKPTGPTIPQISRHDREAKAVKRSKRERELRIINTPLDDIVDGETGEILEEAQAGGSSIAKMYAMDTREKKKPGRQTSFLRLSIDDPGPVYD